jgi:glutamate---cysteine ligase / carboxylate-amine ligase
MTHEPGPRPVGHPEGSTKPGDESPEPALGLFQGFGVELEYMIVDAESLDVRPVADRLMARVGGEMVSEVELGPLAWSNELALHVLEMKTNGPAPRLEGLAELFHRAVQRANGVLSGFGCHLLPGGMHPWMDPHRELHLWPHEYNEVYRAFDRIFSCRGHGWANLQATHLNLPFQGDREFAALHAAVRLLLPLLPAVSAASPFLDGRVGSRLDERLAAYRTNAHRIPSVAGQVVPEPVVSREEYEDAVLGTIYRDLASLDPEGILRHEWVNARGAIARFQRGSIEIRILDAQECPGADLAVVALVARIVAALTDRALRDPGPLNAFGTAELARCLDRVIRDGEQASVSDPAYVEALGLPRPDGPMPAGEIWVALARGPGAAVLANEEWRPFLEAILEEGPLARRLLRAAGPAPTRERLRVVYRELARCLEENRPFREAAEPGP